MTTEPTPPTRRRWFQFRLRTLLVVMLVVSLGMGWVMKERRRGNLLRESLANAGADWFAVYNQPKWHSIIFGDAPPALATMLSGNNQFSDTGLLLVKHLSRLEELYLSGSRVTDAGMPHLKELKGLVKLDLSATSITDAGLEHLTEMKQLQRVDLVNTRITDKGLACLNYLPHLKVLWIAHTQVTDAGLPYLKGMSQLQELHLSGTHVTDAGVANLNRSLPYCNIHR